MTDIEKYCPEPLWQIACGLIPPHPKPWQGGGRRRIDDRAVLAAILYVLATGCPWAALPSSFGVTRPTAHRRFSEWTKAGLFAALHQAMLDLLGAAGQIDWSRAAVDAMQVRAVKGGI
jgi:transposase